MLIVQFQPLESILQGLIIADIINDETTTGILEIAGDETFESLLSGCVPKLYAVMLIPIRDVLHQKVNAYRSLIQQRYTL